MNNLKIFMPLAKVDEEKREVWGRAAIETPDRAKEIFDYESSKPHFEQWSSTLHKASGGKSLGNVRAMHGKVSAGKLTHVEYNDVEKAIDVCAKIVDDNEWKKVLEGVYTGFSIGGSYAKRWKDGDYYRYTGVPSEVSIVDLPCMPGADFLMIKSNGDELRKSFQNTSDEGLESGQVLIEESNELGDLTRLQQETVSKLDELLQLNKSTEVKPMTDKTKEVQAEPEVKTDELSKKFDAMAALMEKMTGVVENLQKSNEELKTEKEALEKKAKELEEQPAQPRGILGTFTKAQDTGAMKGRDDWKKSEDPLELMKSALANTARPLDLRKSFGSSE